jgi:hypothetical protein
MSPDEALLQENHTMERLYSAESMMAISESIAHGYLVLLGATGHTSQTEADGSLAFMALAHGNVIDACFGVAGPRRQQNTPPCRAVREAKETMEQWGQSDAFRVGAVQAYSNAFHAVIIYQQECKQLNCIMRCFHSTSLRVKCEAQLRDSFRNLAKALSEQ